MKMIETIIAPFRLDDMKEALTGGGIEGVTMSEVHSYDRTNGHMQLYRGAVYAIDFQPRIKVELVVADDQVLRTVEVRERVMSNATVGDDAILVMPMEDVVKIRTGEHGRAALQNADPSRHCVGRDVIASRPAASTVGPTA